MDSQDYIYQNRIVAFLDVLGFQDKLKDFENVAHLKETEDKGQILVSEKVNEFISTFKKVTQGLDKQNIQYYLFSDNICITVDYITNPKLIIDLLFTIIELFSEFASIGYFLRGAIEVGKFIDEPTIALGTPLSQAYLAETKLAVFPRILISEAYFNLIKDQKNPGIDLSVIDYLILHSCEFYYLNTFYAAMRKENKLLFFGTLKVKIEENLTGHIKKENIFLKYQWLAKHYNLFLDLYIKELIFTEDEEFPENTITDLQTLKIIGYGI